MSIECRGTCMVCDYPIALDPYKGCSHNCRYCYVKDQHSIAKIEPKNQVLALKSFISGHRNKGNKMFDWDIPIKIGTMCDPLQECEKEFKVTLKLLEVLAETKYPFILQTKNPIILTEEPWFSAIKQCNCVLDVSIACEKYDKLEPNAPTYNQRLNAIRTLSKNILRILARVQPYFVDAHDDIMREIPIYANAGLYGVIVEGYSSHQKQKGLVKDGKYCFPIDVLVPKFKEIREECHKYNLRFFCGEDRIRWLGDDICCCGTENLPMFKPATFNVEHMAHDKVTPQPSEIMKEPGTSTPFSGRGHRKWWHEHIKNKSYTDMMHEVGDDYVQWYRELREEWGD